MSENLEALERRTRSVQGIRSVVRTMKTLSAINAAPCEQALHAITAYQDAVLTGIQAVLQDSSTLQQLARPAIERRIILALGTDHGLCGNYNDRVAEQVVFEMTRSASSKPAAASFIVCVGAQLEEALVNVGISAEHVLFTPSSTDGLTRLARDLVEKTDKLTKGQAIESVNIQMVYTSLADYGQLSTVTKDLYPVPENELNILRERQWPSRSRPWFRQSEPTLLAALLRNYLFSCVCQAAAEALLTENRARLTRMRQAEEAVDEQLAGLTARSRSSRQNRITEELQDVIAGFEAVKII